jgi:hypothetical protein
MRGEVLTILARHRCDPEVHFHARTYICVEKSRNRDQKNKHHCQETINSFGALVL